MFIGRLIALLAALASSGTPVFAQALHEAGWSAWQVSGARSLIGFLILVLWQRGNMREARKDPWGIAGTIANGTLGTTAYLFAAMHASLGTVVSLLYLNTVWITLWERFHGRRERFDIVATGMVVGGVVLAVGPGGVGDTWLGIGVGLFASVTAAIYNVLSSHVTQKVRPAVLSCYGLIGGAIIFGPLVFSAPWLVPHAAIAAAGIGTFSGALFFVAAATAFQRIGVEARMWLPFDLIFVWLLQALIQQKVPSVASCVGVAMIFSAAMLLAWGKRRHSSIAPVA